MAEITVQTGASTSAVTVLTGAGSSTVTVSAGARGPAGPAGSLTAHKSSHATGGSDELTPADIGAATAAQGTDSREWTAATVEQAEAEAGTATTRRAWTAQRVKQAIAAWFGSPPAVNGAALVSTTAGVRSWTGASITLAPETTPGVSYDSGYISTSAGGHIETAPGGYIQTGGGYIYANDYIYTASSGYINTGAGGFIDTGNGGSLTTGTGALSGPNTSGTIALIDPASGTQTFSGAQTFSGQVELTNQAATNATSAMTRALGDSRGGRNSYAVLTADEAGNQNTTTLKTSATLSIPLEAGTWMVEALIVVHGNASYVAAGTRQKLGFTGTGAFAGSVIYVSDTTGASSVLWPNTRSTEAIDAERLASGQSSATLRIGKLTVTVAGNIVAQFAQQTATASASPSLAAGSYIKAYKIA